MLGLVRLDTNPNAIYVMDGIHARKVRSDEVDELTSNLAHDTGFRYYDLTSSGRPQILTSTRSPSGPRISCSCGASRPRKARLSQDERTHHHR